jgi:anti-sigma factor RsiW
MTLAHEDANARLLDLVYGEGTADERAAIEAHVATCAACQAELASLGDTRARLRTALEDAPVPARAHARILEAATQAAAPVAAAARAAAAAAPALAPVRARAARPDGGPSFWSRLRGKWTLPTFATVGAVAVVVIASKVFLEPEKTMQRGRDVASKQSPMETEAMAKLSSLQKEDDENLAKATTEAEKVQLKGEAFRPRPVGPGHAAAGTSAFKDAHGGRPGLLGGGTLAERLSRSRGAGSAAPEGLGGAAIGRGVAAAPPPPKTSRGALDDLTGGRPSDKVSSDTERGKRDFAPPPSGWKGAVVAGAVAPAPAAAPVAAATPPPEPVAPAAPAPATVPVEAPAPAPSRTAAHAHASHRAVAAASAPREAPAVRHRGVSDNPLEGLDGFSGGVPSASEEADRRVEEGGAAVAKKKAAPEEKAAVAANEPALQKAEPPPSQETLTRRADRLFAAQRWSEAVAAYEELLRLYPDADLKPRWRERVAQAKAYVAKGNAEPAMAKKAAKAHAKAKPTSSAAAPAKE